MKKYGENGKFDSIKMKKPTISKSFKKNENVNDGLRETTCNTYNLHRTCILEVYKQLLQLQNKTNSLICLAKTLEKRFQENNRYMNGQ